MAIMRLIGFATEKSHLRTYRMGPVDHRDIEALNPVRIALQAQLGLQLLEHFLTSFLLVVSFGKTLTSILLGHLDQLALVTLLRHLNAHVLTFALAQIVCP